jgi:hypothetical protein
VSQAEQGAARRRERWILLAVLAGLVAVVVGGGIGLQAWRTGRSPAPVAVAEPSAPPATITAGLPVTFGMADAPRLVTVFADFHCAHCAEFDENYGPCWTRPGRPDGSGWRCTRWRSSTPARPRRPTPSAVRRRRLRSRLLLRAVQQPDPALERRPAARPARGGRGEVDPGLRRLRDGADARGMGGVDQRGGCAAGITGTPAMLIDGTAVDLTKLTPGDLATMINP